MSISFRRQLAVSGSAAVVLLGGAAAITTVTADTASAATRQTVEHAVTAPVQMPDGRTIRITGMGGYGHQVSPSHIDTIASVAYKTDTTPATGRSPYTDFTPQQTPAGYTQQVTTQSGGGAVIGAGVAVILLFLVIAIVRIRHGASKGDAVLFLLLGVALTGTSIGTMLNQFTTSGVGSLGGAFGGL